MLIDIPTLIEKWQEIREEADDWTTKNLSDEFIDDLKDLLRG